MRYNRRPRREDYDSYEEWEEAVETYEGLMYEKADIDREERKLREWEKENGRD